MKRLIAFAIILAGCGDQKSPPQGPPPISKAHQAAIDEGYKDIQMLGAAFLECSDSDSVFFSEKFAATNSAGNRFIGVACCGYFKGCTIRHI